MNIQHKTVVLTGASGGIGAAIAKVLSASGACLLLSGRDETALQQLLAELPGAAEHAYICADITTSEGRQALIKKARLLSADVLINNAGVNQLALLDAMSETQICAMVNLNMISPILLCRDFIDLFSDKSEALIINIGSILGSIGQAGLTAYCACKAGLRGFTESLRRELADTAIAVVYIAPRATATALNSERMQALNAALGTATDPADIVAASVLAAIKSPKRSYRYIGWPERLFVKLNYIFPALVDNAVLKQLPIIRRYATI